jgi:hypothetical protein
VLVGSGCPVSAGAVATTAAAQHAGVPQSGIFGIV